MDITDALNEEQRLPVLQTEGAVLVTAGAGSGKTRLLTHRIAYLVTEKGVKPYEILAITFTNKAANEMRERLQAMLPSAADSMWISTFHSMCVRLLRRFIERVPGYTKNFSIYGEDEKERIVKKLVKDRQLDPEDFVKPALWAISDAKNEGLSPDEFAAQEKYRDNIEELCDIYAAYDAELRRNNALDYDDLLLVTLRLLRQDEDARGYCQNRFRYIHVDEFQDTNTIQYELVRILGGGYGNIFVVGDEDQSIYGWRGADFRNIFRFQKDFPQCHIFKLERNYRSTKCILSAANMLIKHNSARLDKELWTENDDGEPIGYLRADSEGAEASAVINSIVSLVRSGKYKFSDIAILMRLNALTRSFEEKLLQYGIPHKIFGGFKFFDRKEVKDMLAYLKVLCNPADDEALARIINFPKRGIGDGTVAQLRNYAAVTGGHVVDVLLHIEQNADLPTALIKKLTPFARLLTKLYARKEQCSPSELVTEIIDTLQLKVLFGGDTEEDRNRLLHMEELVASVKQYEKDNEGCTLEDYLQMVSLYSDVEEMDGSDYVTLATVHSAKGLEYKVVYVVGMEEGIFPIMRADSEGDEEEERRLFYVAITRAKERLFITHTSSRFMYGQRKMQFPSHFLREAGIRVEEPRRESYGSRAYGDTYGGTRTYGETRTYTQTPKAPTPTIKQASTAMPIKQGGDKSGFVAGAKVVHPKFGEGVILSVTEGNGGKFAQVQFDKVGKLNLALEYAPLTLI